MEAPPTSVWRLRCADNDVYHVNRFDGGNDGGKELHPGIDGAAPPMRTSVPIWLVRWLRRADRVIRSPCLGGGHSRRKQRRAILVRPSRLREIHKFTGGDVLVHIGPVRREHSALICYSTRSDLRPPSSASTRRELLIRTSMFRATKSRNLAFVMHTLYVSAGTVGSVYRPASLVAPSRSRSCPFA
jgi:hypothetical protein